MHRAVVLPLASCHLVPPLKNVSIVLLLRHSNFYATMCQWLRTGWSHVALEQLRHSLKTPPPLFCTVVVRHSCRRQRKTFDSAFQRTPVCTRAHSQKEAHKHFCINHVWDPPPEWMRDAFGWKGPDSAPTANVVAHLHLPFFLAVSNAAEERLLRSSTWGKTIPLGFALPVSSQQRQKQRKKLRGGKKSLFSEWDVSGLIRVQIKAHLLDYLNIHF